MTTYAELAVTTNFSFLRGASHPQEMVETAAELGLAAIGIADRNSFAGVVRAYAQCKETKTIKLLVGTRLVTVDGFEVLTYPTDRQAYGRLCRLLTASNRKARKVGKGECHLTFEDILGVAEGQIFIALPPIHVDRHPSRLASLAPQDDEKELFPSRLRTLANAAPSRTFLATCETSSRRREAAA